jgi:hypothetical protein
MKKIIFISAAFCGILFFLPNNVNAQNTSAKAKNLKLKKATGVAQPVAKNNQANSRKKLILAPPKTAKAKKVTKTEKNIQKKSNVSSPKKVDKIKPPLKKKKVATQVKISKA